MNGITDVAIVGAGPYGLSVAAHLRRSGRSVRHFGLPMHLWRANMPRGMFLKSQGFASNLSDPAARLTLAAFCRETERPYADYGLPVPLDTFVAYGQWFQSAADLNVEEVLVTGVSPAGDGYELTLTGGETLLARQVVVAVGVEHFAYLPEQLAALPPGVCTHSSAHTDLAAFAGQRVIVVGAGQSALESAALLHEHGAQVQIVMREKQVTWNGAPLPPDRPLPQRLREPEAGLGSGWGTWFYSRKPAMFRHLPVDSRVRRARTALGPAGASWLRGRVEGEFPVLTGQALDWAVSGPDGVRLGLVSGTGVSSTGVSSTGVSSTGVSSTGARMEVAADHVIAATGYRPDLSRLTFLDESLRSRLRTVAGTPVVDRDYQTSAPGLFVVGPGVAPTFGPVMRFVYGADHAARTVGRRLSDAGARRADVAVGAGR
jgi:cation diffusion facilitator CzcD-associated flavoprotein CzcO